MDLHLGVIGRRLSVWWLIEDPGERLDVAPEVNLHLPELMRELLELGGIWGLTKAGAVVVGLERAIDVVPARG